MPCKNVGVEYTSVYKKFKKHSQWAQVADTQTAFSNKTISNVVIWL